MNKLKPVRYDDPCDTCKKWVKGEKERCLKLGIIACERKLIREWIRRRKSYQLDRKNKMQAKNPTDAKT